MPQAKTFTIIAAFGKPDPPIKDNLDVIRIKYYVINTCYFS